MMEHMGLHKNLKSVVCNECAATETLLENIVINSNEEKCARKFLLG